MAELDKYYTALRNADAAGDVESARKIAAHIKSMQQKPTIQEAPETSFWQDIRQGAGNLLAGGIRGAGSIGATILYPIDKGMDLYYGDRDKNLKSLITGQQPLSRNEERRLAMDAGLREMGAETDSALFKTGKLAGEIAGTAGAGGAIANTVGRAVPALANAPLLQSIRTSGMSAGGAGMGTRMAGGAIAGGASAGMVNPDDATTGAMFGGGLPVALKAAGAAGSGIKNFLTAGGENQELAKLAINKYGLPIGLAEASSSPTLKATRSVLNDAPFIGGVGVKQKQATQAAFNREVGKTFGADALKLTPDVLDAAKKRMGSEFDRIWNNNVLKVDGDFVKKLIDIDAVAAKLPKNEGQSLQAEIRDIYSKIATDAAGNPVIDGATANKFQSYLRRRAESSTGLKNELSDLRNNIITTFNKSVDPKDAAALTLNRAQYKAFKTVEPLLNKGEVGVAGREAGDIPASLLPNAVASSYSRAAGTPLAELSKIGSNFLVDRVAKTGGSQRALIQNSMLGGALGTGAYMNPSTLFAIPAAYAANSLIGNPAIAKKMINANIGLLGVNPELIQLGYQSAPIIGSR